MTSIGVTTHLAQHRRNGGSISSGFLSTWRSSMHSFWKSWQAAVVDNYPFAASWPVCSLLDSMVISVLPAPDNVQLVPLRRSKISVDTLLEKSRAENGLARCVRRPEEREMTAAPSKHHTDVNSAVYLCAAICVVIDLVLLSGILRNLLILNENCSIYSILYFLCIYAFRVSIYLAL